MEPRGFRLLQLEEIESTFFDFLSKLRELRRQVTGSRFKFTFQSNQQRVETIYRVASSRIQLFHQIFFNQQLIAMSRGSYLWGDGSAKQSHQGKISVEQQTEEEAPMNVEEFTPLQSHLRTPNTFEERSWNWKQIFCIIGVIFVVSGVFLVFLNLWNSKNLTIGSETLDRVVSSTSQKNRDPWKLQSKGEEENEKQDDIQSGSEPSSKSGSDGSSKDDQNQQQINQLESKERQIRNSERQLQKRYWEFENYKRGFFESQTRAISEKNYKFHHLHRVTQAVDTPEAIPPVESHTPSSTHVHGQSILKKINKTTMGSPILQMPYNETRVAREGLAKFDQTILDLMKPYNDTTCDFVRYGELEDGSYLVCKNFLQHSEALVNIGINGFDGLGCQITSEYPMVNYQYDCTNPVQPACSTNGNADLFNFACVGEITERTPNHTFYSLEDILKRHNLTQKHITLKIDCEGCEWQGFKTLPLHHLEYIDQIIIQMHFGEIYPEVWGTLDTIRSLMRYFVNVNLHTPNWLCVTPQGRSFRRLPGMTIQATLINKRLIKTYSLSRSFLNHPFNFRGCPTPGDIGYQRIILPITTQTDSQNNSTLQESLTTTVGSPIEQIPFNSTPVTIQGLEKFDQTILELMKPYNDTTCDFGRYGDLEDGYLVCRNFFQHSEALVNIGINGFDDLGCQITSDYPMVNYQYDCTNSTVPACSTNGNADLFNFACVGEITEKTPNHTFYSLEDILKRHNLTQKHITLKIDCEGCEWQGFKTLPLHYLEYIDQIIIAFHFESSREQVWGNIDILKSLRDHFVNVNIFIHEDECLSPEERTKGKMPSSMMMMTLVNKNVIKLTSESRSFTPNPLLPYKCHIEDQLPSENAKGQISEHLMK